MNKHKDSCDYPKEPCSCNGRGGIVSGDEGCFDKPSNQKREAEDNNEYDDIPISDTIEFKERIRKEVEAMDIDDVWELLHIVIADLNHRWNIVAIENRMRTNK